MQGLIIALIGKPKVVPSRTLMTSGGRTLSATDKIDVTTVGAQLNRLDIVMIRHILVIALSLLFLGPWILPIPHRIPLLVAETNKSNKLYCTRPQTYTIYRKSGKHRKI